MITLSRRLFLNGSLALSAFPASSAANAWQEVTNRTRALQQCRALVIYQDGTLVLSERYRGPELDQLVPIKSVSKTFVAALTGIALDRGEIPSLNSTLGELIPELIPLGADERVADLTIENLVTMRAGLEPTSGSGYNRWITSSNWIENALSRPFVANPGTSMLYSTASTHVLGAVLSKVTGTSLLTLARYRLGRPLHIHIPGWTRDPQGRYLGGNEMAITITAMIRFGEMYRNKGLVGRTRVLSEEWATRSLQPVTRSIDTGLWYGYGWYINEIHGYKYALARGYGGQIICIIPEFRLTLAITSDPTLPARSHGHFGDLLRLIERTVIPVASYHKV